MSLEVACAACGAKTSVPDSEAGRLHPCPQCGHQNRAPLPGAIEVPPDEPAPAASAAAPADDPPAPAPAPAESPAPVTVAAVPVTATPEPAEPAHAERVHAEPVHAEPAHAEPGKPAPHPAERRPVAPAAAKEGKPAAGKDASPAHKDKERVAMVKPRAPQRQPQNQRLETLRDAPAGAALPEVTVVPDGDPSPAMGGAPGGIYDTPFERLGHLDVALLNLFLRHAMRFLQLWNFLAGALFFCFFAGLTLAVAAGAALCVDAALFLSPYFRASLFAIGGLGGALGLLIFLRVGKTLSR